ncbi:hypothetical protein IHN32_10995 [Deinococcus sp. 14RED07]|uniref:hypothetical protein n=1 Tax=unclassified Deinococcus TaxID=2623546 RepID=UPI001E5EB627|nr:MULTISPECIES: hypothetical protein [unclassified Deinococcus]MCD0158452.1 hypothetical protein [Deinococcus sp. 6GRE01]MCD0176468.1 hypothetical protein [Deinococcus sp. 14RED07]
MKKLSLLTFSLILAACGSQTSPDGGSVAVSAKSNTVAVTAGNLTGSTSFTFTNKAGGREATISTATITWTDPASNTAKSETVSLSPFTLPSGFICANTSSSCNYNDPGTTPADRSIDRNISDADLFSKVLAANPAVTNLPLSVRFNNSQNAVPFTFTSKTTTGGDGSGVPTEAAPAPLITINSTGTPPLSGNLSVSVSGNFDVTSKVKNLVLEIRDSKGNIDNTTYTSANANATFSIDTTKYADGDLTLKAIGLTESNLRGESATQTVKILNVSAPTMTIVSPDAGTIITGPTTVRVQFRQSVSTFKLQPLSGKDDVKLEVRDFRGQVVKTVYGQALQVSAGIYEAFIPLDIIGPEFSSNTYNITATAQAVLADGSTRSLSSSNNISTKVSDNKPPALSILMPGYIADPYATPTRAIITRTSAIAIQTSDDNGVSSLRVDLVCDPATAVAGQICPSAPYSYNVPVNLAGIMFRVFELGALMDAQPYVQNGNYTMRVTSYDGTNANIQEMPIRISRTASESVIAGLASGVVTTVVPDSTPGAVNPTSATWTIPGATTNEVRVITLAYDNTMATLIPTRQRIDPVLPAGTTLSVTQSFKDEGSYRIDYIVQDLTTGFTRYYQGGEVVVKKNPTATP